MISTGYENFTDAELVRKTEVSATEREEWRTLSVELAKRLEALQREYNLKCSIWAAK